MGNACASCEDGKKRGADLPPEEIPDVITEALKSIVDTDGKTKLEEIMKSERPNPLDAAQTGDEKPV